MKAKIRTLKNYEIRNKHKFEIFSTAGITEITNGDRQSIADIIISVTHRIENADFGDVPEGVLKDNYQALRKNKGVVISRYIYHEAAILVLLDFDTKYMEVGLCKEYNETTNN